MRVKHLFLFSLAVLACACTGIGNGNDEQGSLTWGEASLCVEEPIAPGDSLCYHIEFKLDTLAGESELANNFAAVLRDSMLRKSGYATIQETMAALVDSIKAEWEPELAEAYAYGPEYKDMLQYYLTVEGSPVENGLDSIVSYQTTTDCYLGGAHGIYVVQYYNFDRKTGKLLNIGDVIPAAKEMLVLMAMGEQLCEDWDAEDLTDLQEKTGITMLGDLYLTNNFLLKNDSIEFLFNQYEIAPYAAGLIGVTLKRP